MLSLPARGCSCVQMGIAAEHHFCIPELPRVMYTLMFISNCGGEKLPDLYSIQTPVGDLWRF